MTKPSFLEGGLSPAPRSHAAAGDFLRVFCALMIGWYHIWQQSWLYPQLRLGPVELNFAPYVRAGYMFVDVMLLLSGFLLYLPYANGKKVATRDFYARRAMRILPSYWLCLLGMLVFTLVTEGFTKPLDLAKDLLAHLTFTHNLFRVSYLGTRLGGVLWTLAVEVQFYLLLPALAPLFKKHPLVCYGAMVGAALCFQKQWTHPMADTSMFINRLPNMLDVYANGMLAAQLYAKLARRRDHRALIAAAGTAACVIGAWGALKVVSAQAGINGYDALRLGQIDHRFMLSFCGALFLAGGSLSFGPVRALLSNPPIRFLSGLTFNFYMWHQWLAVRLKLWRIPPYLAEENPHMAGEMPWQLHYTLLCFIAALALSALITYLVEKPCARWGSRKLEAWKARRRNDS